MKLSDTVTNIPIAVSNKEHDRLGKLIEGVDEINEIQEENLASVEISQQMQHLEHTRAVGMKRYQDAISEE